MSKIKKAIKEPKIIFWNLAKIGLFKWIPDKPYLKLAYKIMVGKKLNLENPTTYNEKLQWLKLHNKKAEYVNMVDKYEAKKIVSDILGKEYIIPTLGVYDSFDDIDFDKLPNQFVLKCTHDCGGIFICRDKSKFDKNKAKKVLTRNLKRNFFYIGREWPYKNIKPRIIAEQYMTDSKDSDSFTDYKFFCFDGKVDCVMVCLERHTRNTKFYFFDNEWKLKRLNVRGKNAPADFTLPKPSCIDEMFKIAAVLSEGTPFMRVDLYQSCGKIYFGEYTFFPDCGFDSNLLPETDKYFGDKINLEKI